MTSFYPALSLCELEDNRLHDLEIAGHHLLLVRIGAKVHAVSNICPHAGSPLSMGRLIGDVVQCSLHGIRFRLSDGRIIGRAVCDPLEIYETRIRDGIVEIALPD